MVCWVQNWTACHIMGQQWCHRGGPHWLKVGCTSFNVGVAREKPGPTGIEGVLRNNNKVFLAMYTKNIGSIESNEAKFLVILEAIQIFMWFFNARLAVEIDSAMRSLGFLPLLLPLKDFNSTWIRLSHCLLFFKWSSHMLGVQLMLCELFGIPLDCVVFVIFSPLVFCFAFSWALGQVFYT